MTKIIYSEICKISILQSIDLLTGKIGYIIFFVIFICNGQNIRRQSTMQMGGDSLFKPPRLRNEQRIFMLEIRFKLMKNSRLNSDAIIYLVKLIIHLYNLCKTKCTDNQLWNRSFNLMFSTTSVMTFVFFLCSVTSHVLTVTDENRERCIFPILPVNVSRSYRDNASLVGTIFSNLFEFLKISPQFSSKIYNL